MPELSPENLKGLGLSEPEAKVYLAALELGQASIQDLSKKSGVKRTTIYHFIDDLKTRKLIFETSRKKRKLYSAAKPHQLVELERIRLAEIQALVPELMALHNTSNQKPRVTFYEGMDGIREVYADTLQEGELILEWSDFESLRNLFPSFYAEYPQERARRNLELKAIVRDTPTARAALKNNRKLLRDMRLMSTTELKMNFIMYGGKVAMLSFRSTSPFAVLIEDPNIADAMRMIWQALWERLPKAT